MLRRDFLKKSVAVGAGTLVFRNVPKLFGQSPALAAVWVQGAEPAALLDNALKVYGGMQKFISKGDIVVIKPNIGWDRAPEYAANTNPILVGEIIKKCLDAGAKEVKVFDRTTNNPNRCYRNSQIEEVAKKRGAEVDHVREIKFRDMTISGGKIIKKWPIYRDYLEADKIINVPIAKHHSLCRVTLGLKNLMGVMGGNRGSIHNNFDIKLIDIDAHILPTLTIIDGYRILTRNGPSGGNTKDVKLAKALIVSSCAVTADILALELFNLQWGQVGHIREAIDRGLHQFNPDDLNIQRIDLS